MASKIIFSLLLCFCLLQAKPQTAVRNDVMELRTAVNELSLILLHDIFSAPAAGRIYAYCTAAAYEAAYNSPSGDSSLFGRLNDFPVVTAPETENTDQHLAALFAFYFTAHHFIYSQMRVEHLIDSLSLRYGRFMVAEEVAAARIYGQLVADEVTGWADGDGYLTTRTWPRYSLLQTPGAWQPTPPDFSDAIEPWWGSLRTMCVDSAGWYPVAPPAVFSTDSTSVFYRQAMAVYLTGGELTAEQQLIARFWDDNPFAIDFEGHMQLGIKKISPAGHWLNITSDAIASANAGFDEALIAFTAVSVAMHDAFICCWKTKYTYNTIRPETYINTYISERWKPFIQTPPFPEYTSGHSTISAAAATILTLIFGGQFSFTDRSETDYDLPARHFNSFQEAADEASMSRFYGGIHFMPALEQGADQGRAIGSFTAFKLLH